MMANEAEGPQGADGAARKVEIDMEFVPSLPGGRSVFPAEQQGHLVWLIAEGAMTKECFDEMRGYLRYIGSEGFLSQHWDGKPPPDFGDTPNADA